MSSDDVNDGPESPLEEKQKKTPPFMTPAPLPPPPEKQYSLRFALGASAMLTVLLLLSGLIGYSVGQAGTAAQLREQQRQLDEERAIGDLACGLNDASDEERRDSRNVIWRALNGEFNSLPASPERLLGRTLFMALSPNSSPSLRMLAFESLTMKFSLYFDDEQMGVISNSIENGSPAESALAFMLIMKRDNEAAVLIDSILKDSERMKLVLEGKPVPLETP